MYTANYTCSFIPYAHCDSLNTYILWTKRFNLLNANQYSELPMYKNYVKGPDIKSESNMPELQ